VKVAIPCSEIDCSGLFDDWHWILPTMHHPVMIGYFGDTVFNAPDGSLWLLDVLEGTYQRIAANTDEFETLLRNPDNADLWFTQNWVEIATAHGLIPAIDQCLGWHIPPLFGGPFEIENIGVFPRRTYLCIQGQLHRQARPPLN
jgi:hypothetical protein